MPAQFDPPLSQTILSDGGSSPQSSTVASISTPPSTTGLLGSSPTTVSSTTDSFGETTFPAIGTSITSVATSTSFASSLSASPTITPVASSSASAVRGASTAEPSPLSEPLLRDQTVVGIAVGIGVWLVIIIAVLSCLLWRRRKGRGVTRLKDDSETTAPAGDFLGVDLIGDGEMALARPPVPRETGAPSQPPPFSSLAAPGDEISPATPLAPPPAFVTPVSKKAPSIPPLSRAPSLLDEQVPPPLRSNPVSRTEKELSSPVPPLLPNDNMAAAKGESFGLPILSNSPRGSYANSELSRSTLARNDASRPPSRSNSIKSNSTKDSAMNNKSAIVKMRSFSKEEDDHVAEDLPPSLGKLNSWLEENRRRSRMAENGNTDPTTSSHG